MLGETISHYRILEKLGQGGMGEVYLAEDARLGRKVALKFLTPELADDRTALVRFEREARAAATLSSNSIATIHDFDEIDGRPFIVSEYIDGHTLRARIEQGRISTEEAVRITCELATGLAVAHDQHIVHRDLKSANVMIDGSGNLKILDFGLAHTEGATRVTRSGTALGTVSYMSPEQARGEQVDARSDIYSLGVILYEVLTGVVPFRGDRPESVLFAVMSHEPEPIAIYRNDVPAELSRICMKALEKDPARRYHTADEMLSDLSSMSGRLGDQTVDLPRPARCRTSIPSLRANLIMLASLALLVVASYAAWDYLTGRSPVDSDQRELLAILPFENLGAAEDEFLAAGVTGEIAARLAGISRLGVLARPSSTARMYGVKSAEEIGLELGADYVLTGTIQWQSAPGEASTIRVTPQLIRVSDATYVWGDIYDEPVTKVFAVQSSIATKVTESLGVVILQHERKVLDRRLTQSLDAYKAYLRGLARVRQIDVSQELWESAELDFREALALDDKFAAAYAQISYVNSLSYADFDPTEERLHAAREAAEMALELDPELAEAHVAAGYFNYKAQRDYAKALENFEKAVEMSPSDYASLEAMGVILKRTLEVAKAIEYYTRAFELKPDDGGLALELGVSNQLLKRFEMAAHYYDRAISLSPDSKFAPIFRVRLDQWGTGDLAAARRAIAAMSDADEFPTWVSVRLNQTILERDYEEAVDIAEMEFGREENFSSAMNLARVHYLMGQPDSAAPYLQFAEKEYQERLKKDPDDVGVLAQLAAVYAMSRQPTDAIEFARRASELSPNSDGTLAGMGLKQLLAEVYANAGEPETAMTLLEILLSNPSLVSVGRLRTDPVWDPLRDSPRFQRLLQEYEGQSL